jgi:hypothetical protein
MATTYTLEEAAKRLGLSPEELKRRLREDWKNVRSFRDGATLRFRSTDIDELARTLGQASDPGLPLGEAGLPLSDSSEELVLQPPKSHPKKKGEPEKPVFLADDSDDIFALPSTTPPSSGKITPKTKKGDSDVRLDLTPSKKDPAGNQPTEEITLDVPPPSSGVGLGKGSGSKLTNPKSSGRITPPPSKITTPESAVDDGSSEFELSLDSDSDSFELQLTHDSSEEVPLGAEVSEAPLAGKSGINLGKPADSGVSIEKKKKPGDSEIDSDSDFELSLDGPDAQAEKPLSSAPIEDASSEFELTLDDSSGSESMDNLASSVQAEGDIFETDFELPAVSDEESGSEVMSVDSSDTDLENSDFDLAISDADAPAGDDDSASQVVLVDDEAVEIDEAMEVEDEPKPKSRTNRLKGGTDEGFAALVDDEPVRTVASAPPKWGLLPVLTLVPTFFLALLGAIMAFELVRGMAGYQQPSAGSAPLVRGIAKALDFKTGD